MWQTATPGARSTCPAGSALCGSALQPERPGKPTSFRLTDLHALAATDKRIDGRIEADDGGTLLALIGLDRIAVADGQPGAAQSRSERRAQRRSAGRGQARRRADRRRRQGHLAACGRAAGHARSRSVPWHDRRQQGPGQACDQLRRDAAHRRRARSRDVRRAGHDRGGDRHAGAARRCRRGLVVGAVRGRHGGSCRTHRVQGGARDHRAGGGGAATARRGALRPGRTGVRRCHGRTGERPPRRPAGVRQRRRRPVGAAAAWR